MFQGPARSRPSTLLPLRTRPLPAYLSDVPEVIPVDFDVGAVGVKQKLAFMRGLIELDKSNPQVRALAAQIIADAGASFLGDHRGRIGALLSWVQRELLYVHELPEIFTRARRSLLDARYRFGDCDCKVIALGSLLRSIAYPIVLEAYGWAGIWRHVALLVGIPPNGGKVAEWIPAETTLPVPLGWDPYKAAAQRAYPAPSDAATLAGPEEDLVSAIGIFAGEAKAKQLIGDLGALVEARARAGATRVVVGGVLASAARSILLTLR